MLRAYGWPGNVRELQHAVERMTLTCDCGTVSVAHLPAEISGQSGHESSQVVGGNERVGAIFPSAPSAQALLPYREARDEFERSYFHQVMVATKDSINQAAHLTGLHRSSLYEKLTRLKIRVDHK